MKKSLTVLVALAALIAPAAVPAHPLGNFTVNRSSEIVLSGERVYVRYALDLAEIPTFQEGARVGAPGFAEAVAASLVLELDGRRVPLALLEQTVRAAERRRPRHAALRRGLRRPGRRVRATAGLPRSQLRAPGGLEGGRGVGLRRRPGRLVGRPWDERERRPSLLPG